MTRSCEVCFKRAATRDGACEVCHGTADKVRTDATAELPAEARVLDPLTETLLTVLALSQINYRGRILDALPLRLASTLRRASRRGLVILDRKYGPYLSEIGAATLDDSVGPRPLGP